MSESPLSVVNSVKNQLKGLKNNAGWLNDRFLICPGPIKDTFQNAFY
jgi:hypothetical protein